MLPSGGSVGEGYGPMIVSPQPFSESEIRQKLIAVPGKLTTAYLALQLFAPGIETVVVPFDQIIPQVLEGKHEAGLIIHEGQLTYEAEGLRKAVDLGEWWLLETGLPLPLGMNAVKNARLTEAGLQGASAADRRAAAFNQLSGQLVNTVLKSGWSQSQETAADSQVRRRAFK